MTMRPLCLSAVVAVHLAICIADAGTSSRNAIKNLQPGAAGSPAEPVSASPHVPKTEPAAGVRTVPQSCSGVSLCAAAEFCSRGTCQPCRKRRKRCARDSMCCAGNRCINGVCQADEVNATQSVSTTISTKQATEVQGNPTSALGDQNKTVVTQEAKNTTVISPRPPDLLKGLEGESCLRSSDCSKGLCCARHFWSRICKPVLTEGQVCTRHHRKDTHGLELFQRCDCDQGLVCRAKKEQGSKKQQQNIQQQEQQQQQQPRKNNRNLHICQLH
ncbi:dickkopf WNT signaling pathway inhibitor 1a [Tachysurus fulvidraco]|uniref:dickkopf WNT signaling pathway inhibitor 1a n=1 Tax=Tachysurus fulvidraco TaxID=1234273 RepID=UPI000F5126EA|nr:dickkopf WNT signaling pathway inhibitor 1a [Tachysurus fulvidraco]